MQTVNILSGQIVIPTIASSLMSLQAKTFILFFVILELGINTGSILESFWIYLSYE